MINKKLIWICVFLLGLGAVVPAALAQISSPYYITIDPIGNHTVSDLFFVKGTTNLPAGENLSSVIPGWSATGSGDVGTFHSIVCHPSGGYPDGGAYVELAVIGDPGNNYRGSAEESIYQSIDLTDVKKITYSLKGSGNPESRSTQHLDIFVDTNKIFTNSNPTQLKWNNYSWTVVPPYDNGRHVLKFYTYTSNGGSSIVGVDSVSALAYPPVSDFSADYFSGSAPLNVQFSDLTSGRITSWHWDFGDGFTSTDQNPFHQYGEGKYNVSLMTSNSVGYNATVKTNYISVTHPPALTFLRGCDRDQNFFKSAHEKVKRVWHALASISKHFQKISSRY